MCMHTAHNSAPLLQLLDCNAAQLHVTATYLSNMRCF